MRRLILALSIAAALPATAATTRYATDDTYFSLRADKSLGSRVIRKVRSGSPLEILDQDSARGWSRVRTEDGEEGWIQTPNLMDTPSAKERLAAVETKLAVAEAEKVRLTEELRSLKSKTPEATAAGTTGTSPAPTPEATGTPSAAASEPTTGDGHAFGWFFAGAVITLIGMLLGRVTAHSAWGRE